MEVNNKRKLIVCIIAVLLILFIALFVKSCSKLIDDPRKGEKEALLYNDDELGDEDKLLVNGASVGRQTNKDKFGVQEFLRLGGVTIDNYYRQKDVFFGMVASGITEGDEACGIITYRGNSLRQGAVYGAAEIEKAAFSSTWSVKIGQSSNDLSGVQHTGQPLIVQWNDDMRSMLKISESKKKKSDLTEIIYAGTDGKIYFMDLDDGTYTRNPIDLETTITGTGTISSTSVPLYVIGGNTSSTASAEIYIVDLIKGEVIYSFGSSQSFNEDTLKAEYGFSAAALFSDAADCLISQGENGIIYSLAVRASNASGSIDAAFSSELEYTYSLSTQSENGLVTTNGASQAAWGDYIYSVDSSGTLNCIDVNNWQMIWMRKLGECVDATPVIEADKDAGTAYIYIGTALSLENGKSNSGKIYLYKLNAANGNIIWQQEYDARVTGKTDGGSLSSCVVGKDGLSDYVYFLLAGTDSKKSGTLVCLNKTYGNEEYTVAMKHYSISNPEAVYGTNGEGYIVLCDISGNLFMLDGKSGEVKDTRSTGEKITGSPAIFNDMLVVSTESRIYGIKLD
jgi:hypothetical protein